MPGAVSPNPAFAEYPPLHIDGIGLSAFQLADLRARGIFIAFSQIDFRQSQTGITVVGLLTQHRVVLRNRRLAIAALLRQSASVSW